MVIVSARGDFGAAGKAPIPAMRRARICWIVRPTGSASSRRTISSLTARVSAEIADGSNSAGSINNGEDIRREFCDVGPVIKTDRRTEVQPRAALAGTFCISGRWIALHSHEAPAEILVDADFLRFSTRYRLRC